MTVKRRPRAVGQEASDPHMRASPARHEVHHVEDDVLDIRTALLTQSEANSFEVCEYVRPRVGVLPKFFGDNLGSLAVPQGERSKRQTNPLRQAPRRDPGRCRRVTKGAMLGKAFRRVARYGHATHPRLDQIQDHRPGYRPLPEHLNPWRQGRREADRRDPSSWHGTGAPLALELRRCCGWPLALGPLGAQTPENRSPQRAVGPPAAGRMSLLASHFPSRRTIPRHSAE
jgi:hypothetical protein